jgi:hypothetical protein
MDDPFLNSTYRQPPQETVHLLRQVAAPPRLVAHLILVHDVATTLVERITAAFPEVAFNSEAVLFGASIHDFGKVIERSELVGANNVAPNYFVRWGCLTSGEGLLIRTAIGTKCQTSTLKTCSFALADKCWKGRRLDKLESKIVALLSAASSKPEWACYAELDEILEGLAKDADTRLAWQQAFETS